MALTGDRKREYQNAWIQARRKAWIDENGPCVDCGSWDRLEVDHRDANTKILNPSRLWSMSLKNPVRVAELDKCVVRCNPCHKNKTVVQKENAFGEQNSGPGARYTEGNVKEVVLRYRSGGISIRQLSLETGIPKWTIQDWLSGRSWKYLDR